MEFLMKLNYKRTILVGFAFFLISAFWQAYDAIIPLILTNHFGLPQSASGAVMSIDNILAVFMLPVFGAISDKVTTRFGKRKPFIFIGAIAAALSFVFLMLVDMAQFNAVIDAGFDIRLDAANEVLKQNREILANAIKSGESSAIELAKAGVEASENIIEGIRGEILDMTLNNIAPLIGFIAVLLLLLISMATFRSPAVALMPDVTIKPLRSKANAIINLTGTAGGIIVLVLGMIFKTSGKMVMNYIWYVLAVVGIMLLGLVAFSLTVRERQWSREMEEETARLGLEEKDGEKEEEEETPTEKRKLSKPELISLMLILASVALWYIGYNAITSKYSVYATNELGFDYNFTLIVAQAAAIITYIPVGVLASKIGRRKSILIGVAVLTAAFLGAAFVTSRTPAAIMYPLFALAGIGWATINVNSFPMVVELAKGGDVGKYTGFYYTASMSAQIVTPILSGTLVDIVGWGIFFPYAALFVALSFVTMYFVKHGDAKPEKQGALEALAGGDDD